MADQATNGSTHIRTFAKDLARLSGKNPVASTVPVIQKIEKKTVPPLPTPPPAPTPVPDTTTEEGVTLTEPQPITEEPVVASPTPAPVTTEAPLGAPSADSARDVVLARLRANTQPQAMSMSSTPAGIPSREEILARLRKVAGETVSAPMPTAAPLHTYKSDFAERVQQTKASPLSVLAAEQDLAVRPKSQTVVMTKQDRRYYLIGVALIVLAVAGTFAAYFFLYRTPLVPAVPNVPSLVFAEERVEVPGGTGALILSQLMQQMDKPLSLGQVRILYTATSTRTDNGILRNAIPTGPLIRSLPVGMPNLLTRAIQDESTLGIIHAGEASRPFLILRVDSFERSFAGMLQWESSMKTALAQLYPSYPSAQPVSTSTPIIPEPRNFIDEVVANHDARVLYDLKERVLMLYGYHDKETLIIARDKEAFSQLVERLSTTR